MRERERVSVFSSVFVVEVETTLLFKQQVGEQVARLMCDSSMKASGEVKREVWVIRTGDAAVHVIEHSLAFVGGVV